MVAGIMVAGMVEGIMVEAITVAGIMAAGIMVEAITVEGITMEGITVEDIMPDVVAITVAMPPLTPLMPCMVTRLTTMGRTIIGMGATPSALTRLGTIGGIIGITGAGAGPIFGAMC
jgi:hypothetical protein